MTIALVYHSGYGKTALIANKIAEGMKSVYKDVEIIPVSELMDKESPKWNVLHNSKAILFGAPTYMGSASADFQKFAEISVGPWYSQKWKDKFAGGFTTSSTPSGDKLHSLIRMFILACQHSMLWISTGSIAKDKENAANNPLGFWVGCALLAKNAPPEEAFDEESIKHAKLFGERFATIVKEKG